MKSKYLIIVILSCLLAACAGKQTKHNEMHGTRHIDTIWAKYCDGLHNELHLLKQDASYQDGKKVLNKGQKAIGLTSDIVKETDRLIMAWLERNDELSSTNSRVLNNYFKQYLCYKEKGQVFVFVNLYAYRTTTYVNEGNVTHTFAENPNTTVINPKKGTGTNYMILLVNLTQKTVLMPF